MRFCSKLKQNSLDHNHTLTALSHKILLIQKPGRVRNSNLTLRSNSNGSGSRDRVTQHILDLRTPHVHALHKLTELLAELHSIENGTASAPLHPSSTLSFSRPRETRGPFHGTIQDDSAHPRDGVNAMPLLGPQRWLLLRS
jgi:hypothetical protein